MKPPPLRNDCFAMPPGVNWTPVSDALDRLRQSLHPVVESEVLPVSDCGDRVLARSVRALSAHPPFTNSAVDGFGFAAASLPDGDLIELPLVQGRAAAGAPFGDSVPLGSAIRILTGALVPKGVDTVILEEDCSVGDHRIGFRPGLKKGANLRPAGEDLAVGADILQKGSRLRAQDLSLLAACGVHEVEVFNRLKVGVFSTGDEVVSGGGPAADGKIFDANGPMLLEIIRKWGFEPIDMGHLADNPTRVREALNHAATVVDALMTTGGASAGDEDHISAVLSAEGTLHSWRIALKPGRPLAMAMWSGMPVFGLPGNPVAAFVCTLIFARPALFVLAGMPWGNVQGFAMPAAFSKRKKAGRREYLRARIENGCAEIFHSEGSGRISGLSWSSGLVELDDGARDIAVGDPVTYYPYSGFGL